MKSGTGAPTISETTTRYYDQAGRLVAVLQPDLDEDNNFSTGTQAVWKYAYDSSGNQTSQTDPLGRVTSFTYDELGRRKSRTLPAVSSVTVTETWEYDEFGRVEKHVDFKGNQTVYAYDALGRLEEEKWFDPSDSTAGTPDILYEFTYDDLGRKETLTETRGAAVRETEYAYDPVTGQVSSIDSPEGSINYEYDPATSKLIRTYTDNNDTSYEYNGLGQLWKVTATKLNGQTVNLVTIYTYDPAGNLDLITQPNGVITDHGYDDLNRLTSVIVKKSNENKLFEQTYELEADGLRDYVIEKRYDGNGNASSNVFSNVKINWTYDALGRLEVEDWDSDTTPGNGSDNFGVQDSGDYTDTFTFDLAGNRLTKLHDVTGTDETITYTYNARDLLTQEVSSINGTITYVHDDNGSQTSKTYNSQTDTFTYDQRNKMVGATVGGTSSSYVYDYDQNRVSQTTSSVTTFYLPDTNNLTGYSQPIEQKSSPTATPTIAYIIGDRVLAQGNSSGAPTYLMIDGHGSTRGLINSSGVVTSSFNYEAFGGAIGFTPSSAGTIRLFGGDAVYDPATGMYIHGNGVRTRYDFRFLQGDPIFGDINSPLTLHRLNYTPGNPISFNDPTGMFFSTLEVLVNGGINSILASMQGGVGQYMQKSVVLGLRGALLAMAVEQGTQLAMTLGVGAGLWVVGKVSGWAIAKTLPVIQAWLKNQRPNMVVKALPLIRYHIDDAIALPLAGDRMKAIERAWELERQLIQKTGRGTRNWTVTELNAILDGATPQQLGYTGHHINKVHLRPDWEGDPRNIAFLRQGAGEEHMVLGHPGGTSNPNHPGGLLIDREAMLNSLNVLGG